MTSCFDQTGIYYELWNLCNMVNAVPKRNVSHPDTAIDIQFKDGQVVTIVPPSDREEVSPWPPRVRSYKI